MRTLSFAFTSPFPMGNHPLEVGDVQTQNRVTMCFNSLGLLLLYSEKSHITTMTSE